MERAGWAGESPLRVTSAALNSVQRLPLDPNRQTILGARLRATS